MIILVLRHLATTTNRAHDLARFFVFRFEFYSGKVLMLVAKDLEKFICELEPVGKCNVRMT